MLVRGDFAALHALYESVDTGSEATVLVDASVHYFYTKGPNVRSALATPPPQSTQSPVGLILINSSLFHRRNCCSSCSNP